MKAPTLETGNNISALINIQDESFHQLNQHDCNLALLISTQRLCYSIVDNVHNKVVSLTSVDLHTDISEESAILESIELLTEERLLRWDFNKVSVAIHLGVNTLVPNNLFDPSEKETYMNFSSVISPKHTCLNDYIPFMAVHNVYSIPEFLIQSIKSLFEKPKILHGSTPFIYNSIKENRSSKQDHLLVNYDHDRIEVLGLRKGEFIFYNSFTVKTNEDFVYFLMACCEELSFNPEVVKVSITGSLPEESILIKSASEYFKKLFLGNRPKAFKYSNGLSKISAHQFSNLFSINLCE